jgi:hypothetical protein
VGTELDLPVGDPGEMRRKAWLLGLDCEHLLGMARDLAALVEAMEYECRAAQRFREEVRGDRVYLEGVVDELREVQRSMLREAGRVEDADALIARAARIAALAAI